MFKKSLVAATVTALSIAVIETNPVEAVTIAGTITADNHYALYYGAENGSGLTFVGRNEKGTAHIPDSKLPVPCSGSFNWSCPEAWEFSVNPGDHLYVVAWNDGIVAQSWIGEFRRSFGETILSNTNDWDYTIAKTRKNPGEFGDPLLENVAVDIAGATADADWATPHASAPQGSDPWGTIPGISSSARFVWHDTLESPSTSDNNYVIFRTKEPVPEPLTILGSVTVLGVGALLKKEHSRRLKKATSQA